MFKRLNASGFFSKDFKPDEDELDGDFDDREDKDIDNDGDTDDSDEYLHKKRQAISKAMKETADSEAAKPKVRLKDIKNVVTTGIPALGDLVPGKK